MNKDPIQDLSGLRILMIGIGFYDYEDTIATRLRERGADLVFFEDRPKELRNGLIAGMLVHFRWLSKALTSRHERKILAAAHKRCFDQVLVIKGDELSTSLLRALRDVLPRAEFVMYQWDSLNRLNGMDEKLPLFHRVLSFDRKDASERSGIIFRPLFFRELPTLDVPQDIDISFVGWLHSDRLEAIRRMQVDAKEKGLSTYVYLYTGWKTWLKLIFKRNACDVHTKTLSYREMMMITARSRCVYDLPHPLQTGMTMRTIEAVGASRKLITSAKDIVNYDFYSTDNIRIIEPNSSLDSRFVKIPYSPIDIDIRQRYTLDSWIGDVLTP